MKLHFYTSVFKFLFLLSIFTIVHIANAQNYDYTPSGYVSNYSSPHNIEFQINSFSSSSKYCTWRVRKKDGTAFGSSVTIDIHKNSSSGTVVKSIFVPSGNVYSTSNNYYFDNDVNSSSGTNYYATLYVGGFTHIAGPINIYQENTPPNLEDLNAGELGSPADGLAVQGNDWDEIEHQVKYTDDDGDSPSTRRLRVRHNFGSWLTYTMNAGNGSYTTGRRYYREINYGTNENDYANWEYYYDFDDGDDEATGEQEVIYKMPYLYDHDTPSSIQSGQSVTFEINYRHQGNYSPYTRKVHIKPPGGNWFSYNMNAGGGSYSSGISYTIAQTLNTLGTWEIKYDFHGGKTRALGSGKIYTIEVLPPPSATISTPDLNEFGITSGENFNLVRTSNGNYIFQVVYDGNQVPTISRVWVRSIYSNTWNTYYNMSFDNGSITNGLYQSNEIGASNLVDSEYKFDFSINEIQATGINGTGNSLIFSIPKIIGLSISANNSTVTVSANYYRDTNSTINHPENPNAAPVDYKVLWRLVGSSIWNEMNMNPSPSPTNTNCIAGVTYTASFQPSEEGNYEIKIAMADAKTKAIYSGDIHTYYFTPPYGILNTPQVGEFGIAAGENFNLIRLANGKYVFQCVFEGNQPPNIKRAWTRDINGNWAPFLSMSLYSGDATHGLYRTDEIDVINLLDKEYKFDFHNGSQATGINGTNNSLIFSIPKIINTTVNEANGITTVTTTYIRDSNSTITHPENPDAVPVDFTFYWREVGETNWSSPITMTSNIEPTNPNCETGVIYTGNFSPSQAGTYEVKIAMADAKTKALYSGDIHTVNLDGCAITNPPASEGEAHTACCYLMDLSILATTTNVNPDNYIIRQDLAKIVYLGLFLDKDAPTELENFATYFYDLLQENDEYHEYAIALSYLEFQDGISPFSREYLHFNPENYIKRKDILKVFLEAFNIEPNGSGTSPFTDVSTSDPLYGYIKKAADLGIVSTSNNNFYPENEVTRREAFLMLYRILTNNNISKPTESELNDLDNYFIPLNYRLDNLSTHRGLNAGVFTPRTRNGFNIRDIGFDLVFQLSYDSYKLELPKEIQTYRPLGYGWSHPYQLSITEIDAAYGNPDIPERDYVVVSYPNGTYHVFEDDTNYPAVTLGTYTTLEKPNSTKYELSDKHGKTWTFNYQMDDEYNNPQYLLTEIEDRNGNILFIAYETGVSGQKRIDYVQAHSGRKLFFEYKSGANLIDKVIDPDNRAIEIAYDSSNRIITYTDAENRLTQYTYDNSGNPHTDFLLTQMELPLGNTIGVSYENRKVSSLEINEGGVNPITAMTSDVDVLNHKVQQTITSNGISNTYIHNFDTSLDLATSLTGAGINVTYAYGDFNNPTLATEINSDGLITDRVYDSNGNLLTQTIGGDITHSFTYDNTFNLPLSYTDPNNNTTNITRDNKGNPTEISDALGKDTDLIYNNSGLPTSITNAENIEITLVYDIYGNALTIGIPAENIYTNYVYDILGRVTSVSQDGKTSNYVWNKVDRVTQMTDPMGFITSYQWDNNDNLEQITNAKGQITDFDYNDKDELIEIDFEGISRTYSYFDDGKLEELTKPSGADFNYVYDEDGRLIDNGYAQLEYYITGINTNLLKKATNVNGYLQFYYDNFRRMNHYRDIFGNHIYYEYDDAGNKTEIEYPNSKKTNYTYNANNDLIKVEFDGQTIVTYTYRDDRKLETITYGNGVATTYTYDNAGRMTGISTEKSNGDIIVSYQFDLNPSGQITSDTRQEPFGTMPVPTIADNTNYYFNADNNRIDSLVTDSLTYIFAHDEDGNITTKTTYTSLQYDINNRLTHLEKTGFTADYLYDAYSMLRQATRNGVVTRYLLDITGGMENIIAETNSSNTIQNYYIHGLGLAARVSSSGTMHYYHSNYQGSIVAMTDANENITHQYQYDAYGRVLQKTETTDTNPFRFVGQFGVMQETEDLYFMRARFYDTDMGRFLSEDPIWAHNLYNYTANPIENIDPSGKTPIAILAPILAPILVNAIIGASTQVAINKITGNSWNEGIVVAGAIGALGGAFAMWGNVAKISGVTVLGSSKIVNSIGYSGAAITNFTHVAVASQTDSKVEQGLHTAAYTVTDIALKKYIPPIVSIPAKKINTKFNPHHSGNQVEESNSYEFFGPPNPTIGPPKPIGYPMNSTPMGPPNPFFMGPLPEY